MCKVALISIHVLATVALVGAGCYIYLNEAGRLDKVKRQTYNKMMDLKEDIKRKIK